MISQTHETIENNSLFELLGVSAPKVSKQTKEVFGIIEKCIAINEVEEQTTTFQWNAEGTSYAYANRNSV